jgi:hypothetical protein
MAPTTKHQRNFVPAKEESAADQHSNSGRARCHQPHISNGAAIIPLDAVQSFVTPRQIQRAFVEGLVEGLEGGTRPSTSLHFEDTPWSVIMIRTPL